MKLDAAPARREGGGAGAPRGGRDGFARHMGGGRDAAQAPSAMASAFEKLRAGKR